MTNNHKIEEFKQRRKNFLPTLFLAILFWGFWGHIVFRVPPDSDLSIIIFCLLLFLALFLTSALITANSRLGSLIAILTLLVLIFRYYQIGNPVNLFLLAGIFAALGVYWVKR